MDETSVGEDAADMTCPSCEAENIEQVQGAEPIYMCRVCSAEFRENGELVDNE